MPRVELPRLVIRLAEWQLAVVVMVAMRPAAIPRVATLMVVAIVVAMVAMAPVVSGAVVLQVVAPVEPRLVAPETRVLVALAETVAQPEPVFPAMRPVAMAVMPPHLR